ncbi:GNAT family N-acetyltransferase [Paraclostridium ghonii]|uniref:N-acetylglutamate synthase-like GNAT family acetyltransferase n=1 Tax=Paraclostridium ghonii TaxID=29358 RepID=A0ABU0N5C3_9FIRM|nr:GNAT family N-acetyltransferase [Paeniclostridium ghonii]MDQ0558174.1 N-acetylglutamate synthase-like GNAT family acetyltransferase [Paeniclostridium ghonii]
MKNITIRRFRKCDAKSVSELVRRNSLEVNIKDYTKEQMERLANIFDSNKVIMKANSSHMYVACINEKVVGCGAIARFFGKDDESILSAIFVLPEFHGKGIGKLIVETLEKDDYFTSAKRIEIPSTITACSFYKKMGYIYKDEINKLDEEGHYRLEKFN